MKAVSAYYYRIMEDNIKNFLEKIQGELGQDADYLIMAFKNENGYIGANGSIDVIAQAIFNCIHDPDNPYREVLYRIIALNVENIIRNVGVSEFASPLIEIIDKALSYDE